MKDKPDNNEMCGDGRHDEVKSPDLQGWQTEDQPCYSCGQSSRRQSCPERPAQLGGQDGRDIGAHGHKANVASGDLAAVSGQDMESVNTDNGNADHGHDSQYPVTQEQWAGKKKDQEGGKSSPME